MSFTVDPQKSAALGCALGSGEREGGTIRHTIKFNRRPSAEEQQQQQSQGLVGGCEACHGGLSLRSWHRDDLTHPPDLRVAEPYFTARGKSCPALNGSGCASIPSQVTSARAAPNFCRGRTRRGFRFHQHLNLLTHRRAVLIRRRRMHQGTAEAKGQKGGEVRRRIVDKTPERMNL